MESRLHFSFTLFFSIVVVSFMCLYLHIRSGMSICMGVSEGGFSVVDYALGARLPSLRDELRPGKWDPLCMVLCRGRQRHSSARGGV